MKNNMKLMVALPLFAAAAWYAHPVAAATAAQNPWYLGLSGDVTWVENSDAGFGGNVSLGYRFTPMMRAEAQVGYHTADGDRGFSRTNYYDYMGNLYVDFNNMANNTSGWAVSPYIGAGIGGAGVRYGRSGFSNTVDNHDHSLAWQGMAGLSFVNASAPNTEWTLGYRYFDTTKRSLNAHNIELGTRIHF